MIVDSLTKVSGTSHAELVKELDLRGCGYQVIDEPRWKFGYISNSTIMLNKNDFRSIAGKLHLDTYTGVLEGYFKLEEKDRFDKRSRVPCSKYYVYAQYEKPQDFLYGRIEPKMKDGHLQARTTIIALL